MDVRVGPWRRLSAEELMLLNCGAGKDSWESLDSKEIKPVNPKGNKLWIFLGRTNAEVEAPILWPPDAKSWITGKDLTHWKRPWCWERLRVRGEVGDRGWDSWIASQTQQTWVWAIPGDSGGQGSLACCTLLGHKESNRTERQNNDKGTQEGEYLQSP